MSINPTTGLLGWTPGPTQSGSHTVTLRALNAGGFAEQSYTLNAVDKTPSSAPTGFQASSVTQTSITFAWNAATDDVGVTGYRLYEYVRFLRRWVLRRNNITGLGTTLTGLAPNSRHTYAVAATDRAGNISPKSAPLTVITLN
jgi:chitinase